MTARTPGSHRGRWWLTAVLSLVAAAPAMDTRAQADGIGTTEPGPEAQGQIEGRVDGRRAGISAGADIGRAQATLDAWLVGFRRGLDRERSWQQQGAWDDGIVAGERPGRASGHDAGRDRGKAACDAGFARLLGRPVYVAPEPPSAPAPPPPPTHAACNEPDEIALRLPAGRRVSVRPADAERRESPLGWDVPAPDYPDKTTLRNRASLDGHEGDAMNAWIRGYKDGFREEWHQAFLHQRDTVSASLVRTWETDGLAAGRIEGARRRACEDFAAGFAHGFRQGFEQGFSRGFAEGWAESEAVHLRNPVVRVEHAVLLDATGDGVVEPGESITLEIVVANAGEEDAAVDAATWEGVRAVAGRGSIGRPVASRARRTERIELGPVQPGAPFGATVEVTVRGLNGDVRPVIAPVSRPVVIDTVAADFAVRDGALVASVRPRAISQATQPADRALAVIAGDARVELGVVRPSAIAEPELIVPVDPASLASRATGDVELRSGTETWMRKAWTAETAYDAAIALACRLPAASPARHAALGALGARLMAELDRAMDEPKLYARAGDDSDLARLAVALAALEPASRADVERRIVAPARARGEAKSAPRRVRKAVREALGDH